MKTLRILACLLLLFNGTGALSEVGALSRIPRAMISKFHSTYLEHSPFKDFLIPGIILFIVNGVFSLITLVWTTVPMETLRLVDHAAGRIADRLDHHPDDHAQGDTATSSLSLAALDLPSWSLGSRSRERVMTQNNFSRSH